MAVATLNWGVGEGLRLSGGFGIGSGGSILSGI